MTGTKNDLINYRLARAKETFEDARLLAEKRAGIPALTDFITQPITP